MGGDHRSRSPEHQVVIVELLARQPDLTLQEIRGALAGDGISVGLASLWRFLKAQNITLKESLHAAEQDRADVAEKRRVFIRRQPALDPVRTGRIKGDWR
jgi:transposase